MGFSITADIVQGGRQEAYPFYVWFIDNPDGPVWEEMDAAFDHWSEHTGPHLAFFVDPFQRDEWAQDFLGHFLDRGAIQKLLDSRVLAKRFFRERLAERTCRELWIPEDRLPVAIIAARWNARKTVLCTLPSRDGVCRLLQELTLLGKRMGPIERQPGAAAPEGPGWYAPREDDWLKEVRSLLERLRLVHRTYDITTSDLTRIARNTVDRAGVGPLQRFLADYSDISPRTLHLAGSVVRASAGSLDDMLVLADSLVRRAENVASMHPEEEDARELALSLPVFFAWMNELVRLRERLVALSRDSGRDEAERMELGADVMLEFTANVHQADIDRRLIDLMGEEVFGRLLGDSRSALRASEAIFALSDAIHELHEDLSAVLLGFWKASEIEGRRLVIELMSRSGGIPVWNYRTATVEIVDNPAKIRSEFTAGSVGWVLQNARFSRESPWCRLELPQLGERYHQMVQVTRNRFIHRDNLTDSTEASTSRLRVAKCPDGILPTADRCITALESDDSSTYRAFPEQEAEVERRLSRLSKPTAGAVVPRDLSELKGGLRIRYARAAVEKLGLSWVKSPKRGNQQWVKDLLSVYEGSGRSS